MAFIEERNQLASYDLADFQVRLQWTEFVISNFLNEYHCLDGQFVFIASICDLVSYDAGELHAASNTQSACN